MEKIIYEKPTLYQLAIIINESVLVASGSTTDYSEEIGGWEV